ncbi:hypothetical protein Rhal01_02222 [Rubritalea halochordaticola]|uniref:Uncharacterized protein n=1 Tax=Rubritalea halochordaticola TaxID=714537 RepID=A0ABP9V4M5_9BACT
MQAVTQKTKTIKYWERRRILWNTLLAPPSLLAYKVTTDLESYYGTQSTFGWSMVLWLIFVYATAANICYTFAYVAEFWVLETKWEHFYHMRGRKILFVLGTLLGMALAFAGGIAIARLQYPI